MKLILDYEVWRGQGRSQAIASARLGSSIKARRVVPVSTTEKRSPDRTWWPDRVSLPLTCREFEAESVCYVICKRIGIENPSEAYLYGHLEKGGQVPSISLELVMAASGLIERMAWERLPLRKPSPKPSSPNGLSA